MSNIMAWRHPCYGCCVRGCNLGVQFFFKVQSITRSFSSDGGWPYLFMHCSVTLSFIRIFKQVGKERFLFQKWSQTPVFLLLIIADAGKLFCPICLGTLEEHFKPKPLRLLFILLCCVNSSFDISVLILLERLVSSWRQRIQFSTEVEVKATHLFSFSWRITTWNFPRLIDFGPAAMHKRFDDGVLMPLRNKQTVGYCSVLAVPLHCSCSNLSGTYIHIYINSVNRD